MTWMFILCEGGLDGLIGSLSFFFLFSSASLTIAEELSQVSEAVIAVLLSNFIRHRPQKILIMYFWGASEKIGSEPDLLPLLFVRAIPL